jgi:hypothetical protein
MIITLTASNGVKFKTPRYFTGWVSENWPEYSAKPERAKDLSEKAASDALARIRAKGFKASKK